MTAIRPAPEVDPVGAPAVTAAAAPHWRGLDGLRALAIAVVVAYHFGVFPPGGAVGVDLFFVISGFLITSLLVREHDRSDRISLRRFWARRALRLFPALACAIVLAVVVCLLSTEAVRHDTLAGLPWVVLYSGNWARAFGSSPDTLGLLGHTWSLAVEEQFYLVWPMICIAWVCHAKNRARAAAWLTTFVVLDCVYLVYAMNHWGAYRAYYGTDTHAMGLLAGAALAVAASLPDARARVVGGLGTRRLRVAGAAGLVLFACVTVMYPRSETQSALMIIAATLGSVLLVARVCFGGGGRLAGVLSTRSVTWVGQRSYGIYLYHVIVAGLLFEYCHWRGVPRGLAIVAAMLFTLALAQLSYRFVEQPFLRLKARVAPVSDVPVTASSPAGTAALPARRPEEDERSITPA